MISLIKDSSTRKDNTIQITVTTLDIDCIVADAYSIGWHFYKKFKYATDYKQGRCNRT